MEVAGANVRIVSRARPQSFQPQTAAPPPPPPAVMFQRCCSPFQGPCGAPSDCCNSNAACFAISNVGLRRCCIPAGQTASSSTDCCTKNSNNVTATTQTCCIKTGELVSQYSTVFNASLCCSRNAINSTLSVNNGMCCNPIGTVTTNPTLCCSGASRLNGTTSGPNVNVCCSVFNSTCTSNQDCCLGSCKPQGASRVCQVRRLRVWVRIEQSG